MYALVSFFVFRFAAFVVVGAIDVEYSDLFASPRSGVFSDDGVLDPSKVEVSTSETSLGATLWVEICVKARSRPVIASEIVRKPFLKSITPPVVGDSTVGLSAAVVDVVGTLVIFGKSVSYASFVTVGGDVCVPGSLTTRALCVALGLFSGLLSREPLKMNVLGRFLTVLGAGSLELSNESDLMGPLGRCCTLESIAELYSLSFVSVLGRLSAMRSPAVA